ncbi:aminodeoxychorismate synthase component I [Sphingomonas sp. AOB5]|uniref:aminodeoxychorismate synthase component I n=1 Tax=Sphingomonas sp. AOB5 TaxID=3034017 RepID=UPI0023F99283|nr:aminodeoxychorismate synthase component I [Sphingomonas sp. AOB5]MDF7774209.1 aminodeoxychorismate synthase component I [Sphingomonas sp. AOB5]
MLPAPPFVLLDDARPNGAGARLYANPVEIVEANGEEEVCAALERIRASGKHAAGYLTYEASAGFEPSAWPQPAGGERPRLWFGLFDGYEKVDAAALLPDPAGAWAGKPQPWITRQQYGEQFTRVIDLIEAGDIYQANLTFRAWVRWAGAPASLYALIRARAAAGYGALVATGEQWLLSFSPELFFAVESGRLTAKPMKGTAIRGDSEAEDRRLAEELQSDPKQRAENLMIVDLMRNDLSRVARAGSVQVPQLFHVEQYPTVHQMVSTITAELDEGLDAIDALQALFPCGSITGAPKVRAMQIIGEVEGAARNAYTGSIGRIDPAKDGKSRDAMFNVAIRTLSVDATSDAAVLGLGSGLVADSKVQEEWDECLAKGAFVTKGEAPFDLIETMAFDPEIGIKLLERHLARMKVSAQLFGFEFDRHGVRNELQAATFRLRDASRVRLLLAPSGAIAIGIAPMPTVPEGPVQVAILAQEVAPDDFRLRHKTSRRAFYPRVPGMFETIYTDAQGYLTEGSFTSIFVERDGVLVTPPLSRGLLPGVLRAELIESGKAIEGDLTPADLEHGFFIGNALRGLVSAVTVAEGSNRGL